MELGGAGGKAGLDLCQVAVTGAPQQAHIRPHLSPPHLPLKTMLCVWAAAAAGRGFESPDWPRSSPRHAGLFIFTGCNTWPGFHPAGQ
eukprot:superscaffoldBa00005261_g20111